jgi:hypothetical protein
MDNPARYTFSSMQDWIRFTYSLTTAEALSEAYKTLQRQQNPTMWIHPFFKEKKMGLAVWWLDKRANDMNCYRLKSDNSYRLSHTAHGM